MRRRNARRADKNENYLAEKISFKKQIGENYKANARNEKE
jgi:hypothetical protein